MPEGRVSAERSAVCSVVPIKSRHLIPQLEMVELHLLDQKVKQCRHALNLAVKDRDVKKKQLIQDIVSGAVIEDGPHEAYLKHSIKLVVA